MSSVGITTVGTGASGDARASHTPMKCQNCKIWEILESDLFCSWCGKNIFQIDARERPIRLYLSPNFDPGDLQWLSSEVITNNSPNRISVNCVDPSPWLQVDPAQAVIEPNGMLNVTLRLDPKKLGTNLKQGHFAFQPTVLGGVHNGTFPRRDFEVQVWPPPDVSVEPVEVYISGRAADISLRGTADTDLTLTRISFNPPIVSEAQALPFDVKQGDFVLPSRLSLPKEMSLGVYDVSYELEVEGLKKPLKGKFTLTVHKAAHVDISDIEVGAAKFKRIAVGTDDEVRFSIRNLGEEELEIRQIEVEPISPGISTRLLTHPNVLAPQTKGLVTLTISVDPTMVVAAAPRRCWFSVMIDCNDPDPEHCSKELNIFATDDIHADFIGLDFGTTDSAVALFSRKNRTPENLRLERDNADAKIYSNILFTNYSDDLQVEWQIGKKAKERGPLFLSRFVKAIKTKAGATQKESILFQEPGRRQEFEFPAEDIIKFIMTDLLKFTHVALQEKPVKFILSVPTRFTLRQKGILQEALKNAAHARHLELDQVEVIDESLAAGLYYILTGGPRDERVKGMPSYTLMILDFGGGTTDVTVFEVHQHLNSTGDVEIDEVEIIGAWGDATLGGEAITKDIAAILAEKFLGKKLNLEDDFTEIRKLEDEAEAAKIAVSELQRFYQDGKLDIDEAVSQASTTLNKSLGYLMEQPDGLDNEKLRDYLTDYVKSHDELTVSSSDFNHRSVQIKAQQIIDIFNQRLVGFKQELEPLLTKILSGRASGGDSGASDSRPAREDLRVDIMLLAGQSAQFPAVARIFQDVARHPIDFVRDTLGAPLLKECVSRGALYYISHLEGGENFKIIGQNRQWTRLGRVVARTGQGSLFEELIHWGAEYPIESSEFVLQKRTSLVGGDRLRLQVYENLTMYDDERREVDLFHTFELKLEDPSPATYTCRLEIDESGEVRAACKVNTEWTKMERRS
jgi:molecular chaperone DnaK (HSP70)